MPNKIDRYPGIDLSFSSLTKEEKINILACRLNINSQDKEKIASLVEGGSLDWNYLLGLAELYFTEPFLYRALQSIDIKVPDEAMENLRSKTGMVLSKNVKLMEALQSIACLFSDNNIDFLVLKGAALLPDVYKENGIRYFSDIDILIKDEDMDRASSLLMKNAYYLFDEDEISDYRSQRVYSSSQETFIDIHTGLIGRKLHNKFLGIDPGEIWNNRRYVDHEDTHIPAMGITDTLLYLCLHLSMHHSFAGLRWFIDINEFINAHRSDMDWDDVLSKAQKYKVRRPLYHVLSITRDLFDVDIPDDVFSNMEDIDRPFDKWALKRIKSSNKEIDYIAELAMFDDFSDSVKFVLMNIFKYPYLVFHFGCIAARAARDLKKAESDVKTIT